MGILGQIVRELAFRWVGTLAMVAVAAAGVAAALLVSWINEAAVRETKRVQRDLGFNLRVLPGGCDLDGYRLRGYSDAVMPADVVAQLAAADTLAYNHLVATLARPYEIEGGTAVVTGIDDTRFPPGKKKPPMSPSIAVGSVQLGAAVASRLGLKAGDSLTLRDEAYTVERVVGETGGLDDLRVWMRLSDAQVVLDAPNQISEVRAIDCLCLTSDEDPQGRLREEIQSIVPGTQVVLLQQLAEARARQRTMAAGVAKNTPAIVSLGAAGMLAAIAWYNVRQRVGEFAVERALGASPWRIAALVAGRVFVCVGLGGAIGLAVSGLAAGELLTTMFPITGKFPATFWDDGLRTAGMGVLFAAAAAIGPLMLAAGEPLGVQLRRGVDAE